MLSGLLRKYQSVDISKIRAGSFLKVQQEIELAKISRIVAGSGWKNVVSCPLCGSEDRKSELTKHGVEYVGCLNCSVRYSSKIPANPDDVYKSPNYLSYSKEDTEEHYNYRRERFGRERVAILERYCGDLDKKYLLDVGCGNGFFLSAAMEKCRHCYGTEFSDRLREFSMKKTGLTIFNKRLDELSRESFDIITLFDVIEHIPDPIPFMRSIDRILRPGGYLLIFTPNFDSFSIRVMQQYSSIVDPTEHVVLYSIPSLSFLSSSLGYEIVYHETQGLDIANILSFQQFMEEHQNAFLLQWNAELQAMINESGCGDYGRVMVRKP